MAFSQCIPFPFFPFVPIRRALTARLTTAMMSPSTCEKKKTGNKGFAGASYAQQIVRVPFGRESARMPALANISEQAIGVC